MMKKIGAVLCLFFVAVALSACNAFHANTTKNYPQENPQETTVFLRINTDAIPTGSTVADELTKWKANVLMQQSTEATATKIIDIKYDTETPSVYRADLTIQNVPDSVLTKTVRPFKITYHQSIYNPIALLPETDIFQYNVLYSSERRHSESSATESDYIDGEYAYYWTDATTVEFTDAYPNRPLYIVLVFAGALVIGVAVYLISRYYDCKKRKHQL